MEQSIIIAGFGGQGVLLGGIILANAFMLNDKKVTWYPCYGAEMRGGAVNCEIVVSDTEVTSVHKKEADFVIALNDLSFNKFVSRVKAGGTIIANTAFVSENKPRNDINYIFANISETARESGSIKAANMTALGILSQICEASNKTFIEQAISKVIPKEKAKLKELDLIALQAGAEYKINN